VTSSFSVGRWAGGLVGWATLVSVASAQAPAAWSVTGDVQLGKRAGPRPVANQWVVVHRIASDSAGNVSGGPLDSARTDARGRYRVQYPRADGQATYIAITTYAGVSYITAPLTRPAVTGDDAAIMVFDTIAPPYPIRVAGRHLIVTGPDTSDRRRLVEVYELLNDSTFTVVGTEANPVWRAPLPAGAKDFEINPAGDISPTMVKVDGQWVKIFAPISPGLRQISFSYTLGPSDFPLTMPIVDSATVFEILVQEEQATIEGGNFTEVAGVSQEGMAFRRLLAQGVPARTVLRFTMPKSVSRVQGKAVATIVVAVSLLMLVALGVVFWKRRAPRAAAAAPAMMIPDTAETLVRDLATLDSEFERRSAPTEADRAEFEARRNGLKARLNAALAARNSRG
jgi:hypothetical protein